MIFDNIIIGEEIIADDLGKRVNDQAIDSAFNILEHWKPHN